MPKKIKRTKSKLVERPKLVDVSDLLKKAKQINSDVNMISAVPNESGGMTGGCFGSDVQNDESLINKAKAMVSSKSIVASTTQSEIDEYIEKMYLENKDALQNIIFLKLSSVYVQNININTLKSTNRLTSNVLQKYLTEKNKGIESIDSLLENFSELVDKKDISDIIKYSEYVNDYVMNDRDDSINSGKKLIENFIELVSDKININKVESDIDEYAKIVQNIEKSYDKIKFKYEGINLELVFNNPKEALKRINKIPNYEYISDATEAEYAIADCIDGTNVAGNKTSYDLYDDNGYKAEVKFYSTLHTPITLGMEGDIVKFEELIYIISMLQYLIKFVDEIEKDNNFIIFKSMLLNIYDKHQEIFHKRFNGDSKETEIFDYMVNNIMKINNKDSILNKILNSKADKIEEWKEIDRIYNLLKFIIDEIFNNNCEYVKLLNKGVVYVAKQDGNGKLIIDETKNEINIKCEKMTKEQHTKADQTVKKLIIDLNDKLVPLKEYEDHSNNIFETLAESISKKLSVKFNEQHPLLIVNDERKKHPKAPILLGIFRAVKFVGIGGMRHGVVIIPDIDDPRSAYLSEYK